MLDIPTEWASAKLNVRRFTPIILVIFVGGACVAILLPFVSLITWAAILAYVSWPLYRVARRPFGQFQNAAAFCMTLLLTCAVILPAFWLSVLVSRELIAAYRSLSAYLAETPMILPRFIQSIPWIGEHAQRGIDLLAGEPAVLGEQIASWLQSWSSELTGLLGGVGRAIGKLLLVMITVFFFYRSGEAIRTQSRLFVNNVLGDQLNPYFRTAGAMTRAVLYGFLATAVAQGLIAGIGYKLFGVRDSVLLGAMTGVLSIIPIIGTAVIWGPLSAYFLISGHIWKGVLLLLWGILLVHPTDNILRPLLISNATHVPFIVVLFGVIGGVAACGPVGVFVGPVILAVGLAMLRNYTGPTP